MRTLRSPIWWVIYSKGVPCAGFLHRGTAFDWAKQNGFPRFDVVKERRVTFRKTARQRDKSRYAAYLHADSGLSFIEWLKTRRKFYQ